MVRSTSKIFIKGFGLIGPLGHNAWQTLAQLLAGHHLSKRAAELPDDIAPVDLVRTLGEVNVVRVTAADPAMELAERAAREAIFMANIKTTTNVATILGASKGAVHALTDAASSQLKIKPPARDGSYVGPTAIPNAHEAVAFGPHGYLARELTRRMGLCFISNTVAACASSLTALHHGCQQLRQGSHRQILILSTEAALLPMFIHSYQRLGVLPPLTPHQYIAKPLDQCRQGFVLTEAAAAVLLEISDDPAQPGDLELLDTAIANEADDLIRPANHMHALTHIAKHLLLQHHIDVLHPHATGTQEHDPTELGVYEKILMQTQPQQLANIYACKGALGHCLGTAGLQALIVACLCAKSRKLPPMPWLTKPIDSNLPLSREAKDLSPASTHGIFAAGFGGHVAGVILRKH